MNYEILDIRDLLSPMEIIEMATSELTYDSKVYLFTWNPDPKKFLYDKYCNPKQYKDVSKLDIKKCWLKMLQVLKSLQRCSVSYCIVPEVSDEGKLHCHGWFKLSDKIKWFKSVLPCIKRNGFMKINKLNTPIENIDYYYKEIDETKEILGDVFCVFTDFTYDEVMQMCWRYIEKLIAKEKPNIIKYAYRFSDWAREAFEEEERDEIENMIE